MTRAKVPHFVKFTGSFMSALAKRTAAMQRMARRHAIKNQELRKREISAALLSLQLGLPTFGREAGSARPNTVRERVLRVRDGLVGRFRRVVQQEPLEDPLRKYLFGESESSYFKRVGGRFLYQAAIDTPILAALPYLTSSWKTVSRGFCPCGQHSLAYGSCKAYWEHAAWRAITYMDELLTYASTNGDYKSIFYPIRDAAREAFYRGEQGRKYVRKVMRKSITNSLPVVRPVKWALGGLSDAMYILAGSGLDVNARLAAIDEIGLRPVDMGAVDEIGYLLCELPVTRLHVRLQAQVWNGRWPTLEQLDALLRRVTARLPSLTGVGLADEWYDYAKKAKGPGGLLAAPPAFSKWRQSQPGAGASDRVFNYAEREAIRQAVIDGTDMSVTNGSVVPVDRSSKRGWFSFLP
jgi:hypothetical protein